MTRASFSRIPIWLCLAFSLGQSFAEAQDAASTLAPQTPPVLLQMIRDDSVHAELDLSREQIDSIMGLLTQIDGPWFRARILPPDQQTATIEKLSDGLLGQLREVLDSNQLTRLGQLVRQALGTRMIVRDDVVRALSMDSQTRTRLLNQFVENDEESVRIQKAVFDGKMDSARAAQETASLKNAERKAFVDSLTPTQKRQLGTLTGPSFDFSRVKRMYPLAPELVDEGATWLQGSPTKLSDLRGKVIAVHYYAFQCINCKRNLPHYNGWHQDYADKGLVVIGIQTPETSSERVPDRVAAAAKEYKLEYPVILDADKANWKQWSNTMWPTVYLIDKKGFLRRWWTGEMNWKGTPGEKQMRETIEQLLAE